MQDSALIQIGLPIALFIIMIGMGLSLTPKDFLRVAEQPRGVVLGTAGQLILIPAFGFLVAWAIGGGPLAAGVVLVALCPGGTTSNLICYLARSNLALSITLTVISSFATIFTIPPLVNLALELFTGDGEVIRLPFLKTLITMAVIILIPTGIGMLGDVDLDVRIELGRTRMLVDDVLRLSPESVVELDKAAGDPVDIYVNGRHVARGEVLVLNENFCVRVSEIVGRLPEAGTG